LELLKPLFPGVGNRRPNPIRRREELESFPEIPGIHAALSEAVVQAFRKPLQGSHLVRHPPIVPRGDELDVIRHLVELLLRKSLEASENLPPQNVIHSLSRVTFHDARISLREFRGLVAHDPSLPGHVPMHFYPLRPVALPDSTAAIYDAWLNRIDQELSDPDCDRNELCRRVLTELFYPHWVHQEPSDLPETRRIALLQMDPRNITLEPEYYYEIDRERYAQVKPLIWLWEMFDKSPLGENVDLGVRFRRILARRIFRKCGRNFKAFHFVKLSFGYNLEVGDDVVIHRHVLLDDRGGILIEDGASVSDYANIYSHSHDIVDPKLVDTPTTILGRGTRITYHATVLAGVHVAPDSMVGALAVSTRDTRARHVHVGVPAHPVRAKPDREPHPSPPDPLAD